MSNVKVAPSLALIDYFLWSSDHLDLKFTLYDVNRPLATALIYAFLIAILLGIVSVFIRRSRKKVGKILAAVTLAYLLVTIYTLLTSLSAWPWPVCVGVLAIISLVLLFLGRKTD